MAKRTRSRKAAPKNKVVIMGRKTHRKRKMSGTGAVGATHHRKKRRDKKSFLGSTSATTGQLKEIAVLAVGMAGGVMATGMILRPLESKITTMHPNATKFLGVGEILVGGWLALKAKGPLLKGVGLGVMAGGVDTAMRQFKLNQMQPMIAGPMDYSTVSIPLISGLPNFDDMPHLNSSENEVRTEYVAGTTLSESDLIAGTDDDMSQTFATDQFLQPIGYDF